MDFPDSKQVQSSTLHSFSLFRLVRDQARISPDVLSHHYEGSGTTDDPYLVMWVPEDAGNPLNWSKSFKWFVTMTVAMTCFATAFASSAFSGWSHVSLYCAQHDTDHLQERSVNSSTASTLRQNSSQLASLYSFLVSLWVLWSGRH
jgi:hypothetical protein